MSQEQEQIMRLMKAIQETSVHYDERAFDIETLNRYLKNGQNSMAIIRCQTIIERQVAIKTRCPEITRLALRL